MIERSVHKMKLKNLKERLLTNTVIVYLGFLTLSLPMAYLFPGYFSFDGNTAASFYADDSWCNVSKQGMGVHCFGDYYYPGTIVNSNSPWTTNLGNPYPPLSTFYFKPFFFITNLLDEPRLGLILHLLVLLSCCIYPVLHMYFRLKSINLHEMILLAAFTLTSSPVLVAMDRGNNVILLLPLIYLLLNSFLKHESKKIFWCILLMTLLRPQMIILSLLFLVNNKFSYFLNRTVAILVATALSFVLYPVGFLANILNWIHNLSGYGSIFPKGTLYPTNYSITNLINISYQVLQKFFECGNSSLPVNPAVFSLLCVLLTFFAVMMSRRDSSARLRIFITVTLATITVPGVTYRYYTLMILPIIYLFLLYSTGRILNRKTSYLVNEIDQSKFSVTEIVILHLVIITNMIVWILPLSMPKQLQNVYKGQISYGGFLGSITINVLFFSLIISLALNISKRREAVK